MTRITDLQGNYTVSITVPCLNESKNIGTTLAALKSALTLVKDYEIIVVNDGSTDDTKSQVEALSRSNQKITLINHSTTRGRGYSIKEGYARSSMDYIICFNGKYDISEDQIRVILGYLGQSDLVISYQNNTFERAWIRRLFSKSFTSILNLSFGLSLKYYNGSSLIKRDLFKRLELHTNSYAMDAELLIKLIKSGTCYQEVPVNDIIEDERNTRSISIPNILGVLWFYIRTLVEIKLLRRRY